MAQYTKSQLVSASNATYFTNTSGGISASAVRDLNDSWISSSALLSGSNTFIGNQIISGSLTAQLQANYIWLGDSNGYNQAVATSSISLQGAQGIQGLQGTTGAQGIQGITGAQGITGSQGIQGLTGAQGLQGITGTQGIQGITGASGSQGIQGIQGADNSTQGAQGTTGLQGIQGINGISGSNGAQGTQGIQGIQGADNSTQGATGAQGIQGIQGADNSTQGAQGTQGTNGTQGITGSQGIQGIQGADNSTQGATGAQGIQGIQGLEGLQGTTGTQGVQGFTGAQGIQGITGITGSNGTQGAQGAIGAQGTQGDNVSSGSLLVTGSVVGNVLTFTKGDATTFNLTVATGSGGGGTGSVDTGSLLVTASFASNNITFTKGDASQFSLQGFATTGSNTFNGTQNISGSIVMNSANDSETFLIYRNGQPTQNWQFGITSPGNSFLKTRNRTWVQNDGVDGELMIHYLPTKFENGIYTQGSQLSITGSVVIAGNLTASLQTGYAWVGNSGGVSSLVATSSFGTSINTGSFATTGSNTFIGTQIITGSMFVYNTGSGNRAEIMNGDISRFPQLNVTTLIPGLILDDNGNNITIRTDAGGATNGGRFIVNTVSGSQFTGSVAVQGNIDITGQYLINGVPISGGANIDTGSLMRTGSVAGNVLTFTKGDATTFSLTVATGSGGGSTDTGSLLVTASFDTTTRDITFTKGDATTFKLGAFAITGSNTFNANQTITTNGNTNLNIISTGGGQANVEFQAPNANLQAYGDFNINNNGQYGGSGSIKMVVKDNNMVLAASQGFQMGVANATGNGIEGGNITINVPSGSQQLQLTGSLNVSNTLTASLQQGYAWVGNSSNVSTLVATSSFGGGGTTYINPTLNPYSGSLILVANTFTSSSFAHISASANGQVNLVFKNNNNTADTIISGSNNIFTNPNAPTAGFKRYVGGNNNIINTAATPLISGSMQFSPTMAQNYIVGGITFRGPVSASTWTLSSNVIQGNVIIGSSAANHAEKAVAGFTMTGNSVNGTFNFIANKTLLTQGNQISNNLMTATTLTAASSSILYQNNIGGITVTNNASGGLVTFGANGIYVVANLFAGSNNSITATGSQDTGDVSGSSYLRQVEQNQILGSSNGVNLPYAPTGSNSLNATMLAGYSLAVTGSSPSSFSGLTQLQGSAFFGRWNAQDGNRAQSAQTVFAVGTGNSTTRKTGFLIDSGSNTYVEGTLNVSGSTNFNGNTAMTGSLVVSSFTTLASVSSSLNFADDTAAAAGGVPLGGLYRNGNFVMIRLT